MKSFAIAVTAAAALGAFAVPAHAITYIAPWTGAPPTSVTLNFGNDEIGDPTGAGVYYGGATAADGTSSHVLDGSSFTDTFSFFLPDGVVAFSGISIGLDALTNLTFTSVTFNGVELTRSDIPQGSGHVAMFFSAGSMAVNAGDPQVLVVSGTGGANASWDGSGAFAAGAIPEPGTWALMILGFGGAGAMMRRRRHAIA